jgi:hypothetical protein
VLQLEHKAIVKCRSLGKPTTNQESFQINLANHGCRFSYQYARSAPTKSASWTGSITNQACSRVTFPTEVAKAAPAKPPSPEGGGQPTTPSQAQQKASSSSVRPSMPGDCSDITGAKNSDGSRTACPVQRTGVICNDAGSTKDCLANAKWDRKEPFNHGAPIVFHPFIGPPVVIGRNQAMWNVPDDNPENPEKRKLEAGPWSGDEDSHLPYVSNDIDMTKCAQLDTTTSSKGFQVSIVCELARQAIRQKEFEEREDKYPYIDVSDCKPPWTVRFNDGWEKRTLEYWKLNPQEPIGWCDGPTINNRQDRKRLREPNWHSVKECEEDILQRALEIAVNTRGVRGCKFKGE